MVETAGNALAETEIKPNRHLAPVNRLGETTDLLFHDGFPKLVALAVEMKSVVAELRVELTLLRGKMAVKIQVIDPFLLRHGFQQAVDDRHILPALGMALVHAVAVVGGQDALHDDAGFGRLFLDASHDGANSLGNAVVAGAVTHVVGANHEEHHGWFPLGDGGQAVEDSRDDIRADASVLAMGILEHFRPLTPVGDAVAEEDDVALGGGQ